MCRELAVYAMATEFELGLSWTVWKFDNDEILDVFAP